jgi:hypothetical protein
MGVIPFGLTERVAAKWSPMDAAAAAPTRIVWRDRTVFVAPGGDSSPPPTRYVISAVTVIKPLIRSGRLRRLAVVWLADRRKSVVPAAHDVNPDGEEHREEAQVQNPLEWIVRTEMVEGCDIGAQTDHDRGQTSLPRSRDV